MARLWYLGFSLFVLGANFSFAKADFEDYFDRNRNNDFFGRDHEEFFDNIGRLIGMYALSFYGTKTVLVGPKWFWSDQIDLDLTIMIWSRPK